MSNLAPLNCCTDPDNDQNNTNGWSAFGGTTCTFSSVEGGVTGYRLKAQSSQYWGPAFCTDNFSLVAGEIYNFDLQMYSAILGDNNMLVGINCPSISPGGVELLGYATGLGETVPVHVHVSYTPLHSADYKLVIAGQQLYPFVIYVDNVWIGEKINDVTAAPIIITSSIGLQGVYEVHLSSYCYEEATKGIASDLVLKTKDGIGTDILNIFRRKNTKYLWYDADTNGQDLVVSFYVDGVLQDRTLTINNNGRIRNRLDLWNMEGYRFAIKLNAQDVRERGMKIYSPWNIIYDYAGV